MIKHTPGPWTVVPSSDGVSSQARTSDGRFSIYLGSTGAPADEWQANARLIAAAPDLLAALRRMLDCHQAAMDAAQSSASQFVEKRCDCGACDEARAAIAKAEGTEPSTDRALPARDRTVNQGA